MNQMILMADPLSRSWEFSKKIKDYLLRERGFEVDLKEVNIGYFKNGEIDMHVPENVRKKDIYFVHDSTKNPQEWWIQLILLKDLLLRASAGSITFILPNLLYSRKDRKEKPHVPISSRALADTLSPGLRRLITMDLHASQIQGFYPASVPVDGLHSFPLAVKFLKESQIIPNPEELVILSPDAGGVARARVFASNLKSKNSIAFIYKRRENPGEVSEMILVGDVKDKDVFIVDDIIGSGGTLCKAAELLKKNGARNLYCYGTHGSFTNGTEKLHEHFEEIITSNTNYKEGNAVKVIDMSPLFAEAIYRAQKGESISKLFERNVNY